MGNYKFYVNGEEWTGGWEFDITSSIIADEPSEIHITLDGGQIQMDDEILKQAAERLENAVDGYNTEDFVAKLYAKKFAAKILAQMWAPLVKEHLEHGGIPLPSSDSSEDEETPDGPAEGGIISGNMALVGEAYGCDMVIPEGAKVAPFIDAFKYAGEGIPKGQFAIIGDGSPEHLYPASQYPHVEVTQPFYTCNGPDCTQLVKVFTDKNWIRVARFQELNRYFCSLRCLANWLAGKLAKEESTQ